MTRIVAGTHGGRRLATPPGAGTRPTSELVREALFSSLEGLTELDGCRFADLYAGSGAVGLEAASRGAAAVLLIESDARVARVVRENVATLGLAATCRVVAAKVSTALATAPEAGYDVVFADPPYELPAETLDQALSQLATVGWLAPGAVVVAERSRRSPEPTWPHEVTLLRSRRYGETTLWYGRRA